MPTTSGSADGVSVLGTAGQGSPTSSVSLTTDHVNAPSATVTRPARMAWPYSQRSRRSDQSGGMASRGPPAHLNVHRLHNAPEDSVCSGEACGGGRRWTIRDWVAVSSPPCEPRCTCNGDSFRCARDPSEIRVKRSVKPHVQRRLVPHLGWQLHHVRAGRDQCPCRRHDRREAADAERRDRGGFTALNWHSRWTGEIWSHLFQEVFSGCLIARAIQDPYREPYRRLVSSTGRAKCAGWSFGNPRLDVFAAGHSPCWRLLPERAHSSYQPLPRTNKDVLLVNWHSRLGIKQEDAE
jgi:hypothetical protein